MNAVRIYDGDLVIVRKQNIVENGEIAAVLIDDQDATLKRFFPYRRYSYPYAAVYQSCASAVCLDLKKTNVKNPRFGRKG